MDGGHGEAHLRSALGSQLERHAGSLMLQLSLGWFFLSMPNLPNCDTPKTGVAFSKTLNAPTTKFVPACQECPFFGVGFGTNAMNDFLRMSGLTCSHRWWVLWQSHSSTNTSWTHRICHTRKLSSQFCECRALLLEKGSERKLFLRVFDEDQRHLFSRHCSFAISTARDFCLFLTSIRRKFNP